MEEHRDHSDRLTFEFNEIGSGMYSKITSEVVSKFELEASTSKTKGLDEVFQDFRKGNEVVGLEWDNWSGYIVNAKTKTSESLVRQIAGYISEIFSS